ncbi:MAG: hypothetical protein SFV17_06875 [Candidatus Obscuribacter sp.]|nr:hypothetical protein [Candidatus Melainabacteria bacterium]MDX1986394.1 hypothetical protein [Candidatus Obscuribacter sp.]
MNLAQAYKIMQELVPILLRAGVEESASLASCFAPLNGSERLQALKAVLEPVRRVILASDFPALDTSRRVKVLAAINAINRYRPLNSQLEPLVQALDQASVSYRLVPPFGEEPVVEDFRRRFPMSSYKFVDFDALPASRVVYEEAHGDAIRVLADRAAQYDLLESTVYFTWGEPEPAIELKLQALLAFGYESFWGGDMLVIGPQADWVYEVFHEGELGFALAPF